MRQGGLVKWEDIPPIPMHGCRCGCLCCMGVNIMPTEEELEQRITDQMDRERLQDAMIGIELETLRKGIDKVENVSGFCESPAGKQTH